MHEKKEEKEPCYTMWVSAGTPIMGNSKEAP